MRRFTIHLLILAGIAGFAGFSGYEFWGSKAARIIFLIAADLFVVSLFARLFFKEENQLSSPPKEEIEA